MTESEPRNRLADLLGGTATVNGIDFVEVVPADPTILRVHFLNAVPPLPMLAATVAAGAEPPIFTLGTAAADWSKDADGRPLLTLHLPAGPLDFSTYTLTLAAPAAGEQSGIDRFTASADFSFKVFCPSPFDGAEAPAACPPDDAAEIPVIDYTAKDYAGFVSALAAYSAQAYPGWQERSEADFGRMMMEALAALADELSYAQDRVAAEASIVTATQRRSLVSLARLVDYEPSPVQSATTLLLCRVGAAATSVPAGARVSAVAADNSPIPFEIGLGLNDPAAAYPVSSDLDYPIPAYWWDDDERCLAAGATEIWVQGTPPFALGMAVLIQTDLPGESRRQVVTLTEAPEPALDFVYLADGAPTPVTRLAWGASDALLQERNLTLTNVGGNLLPATQGVRVTDRFAIAALPSTAPPGVGLAVARRGPNATDAQPAWVYRWPLSQAPVAWLPPPPTQASDPLLPTNALTPEIILTPEATGAAAWGFLSTLLRAGAADPAFTIDPVAWRAMPADPDGTVFSEMDGDGGETLRLGDGTFGARPAVGEVFTALYRVSRGAAGNVAPDAVTTIDPASRGVLAAVSNPLAATGGADAESSAHIRAMAPQRFRQTQYRAVQAADYAAAAETLPWVRQASTAFRWTGSWLSVFTAADPGDVETIDDDQHLALVELLNRRRLAGYESFAPAPVYVSLDIVVTLCAAADAIGTDVEATVLAALGSTGAVSGAGFFANRFSFGTPLYRSALEAAVQAVPGVAGILDITYRQREVLPGWPSLPDMFAVAPDRILRIDNDPDRADRGTIQVVAEGGR